MNDNDSFVSYPTERMGYAPGGIAIEPKTNPDLPEGCKPIEGNRRSLQRLMEVHFVGDEIKRAFHIVEAFKLPAGCLVPIKAKTTIEECNLILPEDIVLQLTEAEQSRAKVFVPPAQLFYEPPVLYRFIEKKWVDKFFEVGELQVSSFNRCKTKEVGPRKDSDEGWCSMTGISGDNTVEVVLGVGHNPLLLCFSMATNATHNDNDGCIEVQDIYMFINAVTDALVKRGVGITRVMHGPCAYAERKLVKRFLDRNESMSRLCNEASSSKQSFDFDLMLKVAAEIGGVRHYFTKAPEFSDEHEYRIVWDYRDSNEIDSIMIKLEKDVINRCCSRHI